MGGAQPLGDFPGGLFQNFGNAISNGGTVVVGTGTIDDPTDDFPDGIPVAFRWSNNSGMVPLFPGSIYPSRARAVTPDGTAIVGFRSTFENSSAYIWTAQNGIELLRYKNSNENVGAEAFGVSGDGWMAP